MPREVKAWACEWGCRTKVVTVKSRMVAHETRCIRNPNKKSCPTCKYNYQEWQTYYHGHQFGECVESEYQVWCCEIDKHPCDETGHITKSIVINCEHWKPAGGEG